MIFLEISVTTLNIIILYNYRLSIINAVMTIIIYSNLFYYNIFYRRYTADLLHSLISFKENITNYIFII